MKKKPCPSLTLLPPVPIRRATAYHTLGIADNGISFITDLKTLTPSCVSLDFSLVEEILINSFQIKRFMDTDANVVFDHELC